jgi:putative MATE family efflux protein
MKIQNLKLFERTRVSKAVLILAIPTVLSQLMGVIYNMADTFFIGQLNDPNQVAASTLVLPLFILTASISNLFGIGGASFISRCLGRKHLRKARAGSAFCVWTSMASAFLYGAIIWAFRGTILPWVGANHETYGFASDYLFWTIAVGAIPVMFNPMMANLIRSEGFAKQASIGMASGVILNILLDPIFIFGLDLKIEGAAIATFISISFSTCYFLWFLYHQRGKTVITLNPRYYRAKKGIAKEIIGVGFPSCIFNATATASIIVLNILLAGYSTVAVAGMGIAKRVDVIAFSIANGMAQGVLPLIAYNYAAQKYNRMKGAIKVTLFYSLILSVLTTFYLFFFAPEIAHFFINDTQTVRFGQFFLKTMCVTCPCVSISVIIITIFQAVGYKITPIVLSLLRKGGLDIPLMIVLNHLYKLDGLVWALPIADFLAMVVAIITLQPFLKKHKEENQ